MRSHEAKEAKKVLRKSFRDVEGNGFWKNLVTVILAGQPIGS
jgi:hypothetical protein